MICVKFSVLKNYYLKIYKVNVDEKKKKQIHNYSGRF